MQKFFKRSCAGCVILVSSIGMVHADDFSLTVDKYYSPYMGANLMIAGLRGYQAIDDTVASSTEGNTSVCMTLIRSGKWLFEYSLANFAMVVQHEVFGHGARAREFHMGDIGYHINVFSGATTYPIEEYNALNVNQKAALNTGGVEATSILSQQIERSWMNDDTIDSRAATLYLVNSLDQSVYAFSTSSNAFHPDNDAQNYIGNVNAWHGSNALSSHKLKVSTLWDWLDPMIYMSAYELLKYIWEGQQTLNFSTLHVKQARFMPTTRVLYTPWGPEFQLQNHFFTPEEKYIGVFLRYSKIGQVDSYGADLFIDPIAEYECVSLRNQLSVWYQPHLLKNTNAATNTNKYGFAEFLGAYYQINPSVYAYGELGYKVSGYLQGTQLTRGVIWRLGFKFDLDIIPPKKC